MKEIDYEGLKNELYGRLEFCLNALTKSDRYEAETGFTSRLMTEEEFATFWPEDQEITFTNHGRFQYRGCWFELRALRSFDPAYYDGEKLEGYILFAKYRIRGDYKACSDVLDSSSLPTIFGSNVTGLTVPEALLQIADEYITKKMEETDE